MTSVGHKMIHATRQDDFSSDDLSEMIFIDLCTTKMGFKYSTCHGAMLVIDMTKVFWFWGNPWMPWKVLSSIAALRYHTVNAVVCVSPNG